MKGTINKIDLDSDCVFLFHAVAVFHYVSWWIHARTRFDLPFDLFVFRWGTMCGWPSCQICSGGSSSYSNCCGGMRGPNKCNTCFGKGTNTRTTFVNSFIAVATEAQASEHINQSRDYIHLSHGHSLLHAGPASCWHCLRLCYLPLLLPISVTYQPAWWGESDKPGGMLGLLSEEAC